MNIFSKFSLGTAWLLCAANVSFSSNKSPHLNVAASTFSIQPEVGALSEHSRTGALISAVYGDIKSTMVLLEEHENKLCFFTSPLDIERGPLHDTIVSVLSTILEISPSAIVTTTSHSHTNPYLHLDGDNVPTPNDSAAYKSMLLANDFLMKLQKSASDLVSRLQPATIEWGKAEENRITYNRRGRDFVTGKSYFIREEDRLALGEGYRGLIDPDATVVLFRSIDDNKVFAAFTFFTGHPVAAYNPENLISYGQFPQDANDMLSAYFGGIPVAFLQGPGGDINSKHMLTGTMEQAKELGKLLGETFIVAAKKAKPSVRSGLTWQRQSVHIPLDHLPDKQTLLADLKEIDDFVRRANKGDENTLSCVGMNFPKALSPSYRGRLVSLVRPWYEWALTQYEENRLHMIPRSMPMQIVVARFGDVGFTGLPFEPFVKTGLKIKEETVLPCVLACGYTDGRFGYIPDASAVDDREYMSGAFRYMHLNSSDDEGQTADEERSFIPKRSYSGPGFFPPYRAPGADEAAAVAIRVLNEFAR
ncbi:hypothetical protein GCM10007415_00810 [Parapedobacter pyrenivorans]|uniref:Neutral/alkaline non-lysosomal ceramidase, N-terminal n=1 Tax=Parapedobacter pyrenivorans TaxID=1305674 RepID=A0A917HB62_9SPHI|nr:hypothetical protein [Parapedobacter pyrenivorans]GGG73261.1 hypothetical protein GCM10007415_00810 [Parapedobacter pyrenivorans]